MSLPPPPKSECLSDLTLDRLRVCELPAASLARINEHLTTCADCRQRYALLCESAERFPAEAPAFESLGARGTARDAPMNPGVTGPGEPPIRATWLRRWGTFGAVATAAGVVLLLSHAENDIAADTEARDVVGHTGASEARVGLRTKGASASFDFIVRRKERTVVGISDMTLHPGDRLRFTVSAAHGVHCGVWGVDASGNVSDYATSKQLIRVPAGEQVPLPSTVALDDSVGSERIVAVFCENPQDAAAIRAALSVNAEAPELPERCAMETVQIRKALR